MATAKKLSSAKKAASRKPAPTKKTAAKKTAAKKTAAKKPAAKKAPAKKTAAKKTAAKKAPAKKTAAKKAPAKKTAANKTAAATKSTPVKKAATTKKAAAAKRSAKKVATSPTRKAAVKQSTPSTSTPVKKTPAKKAPAKKAARQPSASSLIPSLLSNAQFERVDIPAPRGRSKDGIAYTKDFDVNFLKSQRELLIERRAAELARATRLEDEAAAMIEGGEMGDVQFDDEGGEGDTMVVQRDLDRVLSTQSRQAILDIDEALARIEAGTYGYSVVSGMPIQRERLEAIPETTVLAAEKVSGAGPR